LDVPLLISICFSLSKHWNHCILGINQPWDPDYDIKFGVNFSIEQTSGFKNANTGSAQKSSYSSINLMICVDQSDILNPNELSRIGGWASQGMIMSGVQFSMMCLGYYLCTLYVYLFSL
jgi:hypothetical protein